MAAAACLSASLCCSFRTGGSQTSYIIRIRDGGCAAYLSFVNFEGVSVNTVGVKKWPEPGVELEWILPSEPICKNQADCKELLNSKCSTDPIMWGRGGASAMLGSSGKISTVCVKVSKKFCHR